MYGGALLSTLPPMNRPPVADAGGPYTGYVGYAVSFDGSDSYDRDDSIVNYTWDFGDRGTGFGVNPTHKYTTAVNYTVALTVTDNDGLINSSTTLAIIEQDTDEDGWSDKGEERYGSDPENATSVSADIDNDYISDVVDEDDDNDGLIDEVEGEVGSNPATAT
jgi:PKD repeat protein